MVGNITSSQKSFYLTSPVGRTAPRFRNAPHRCRASLSPSGYCTPSPLRRWASTYAIAYLTIQTLRANQPVGYRKDFARRLIIPARRRLSTAVAADLGSSRGCPMRRYGLVMARRSVLGRTGSSGLRIQNQFKLIRFCSCLMCESRKRSAKGAIALAGRRDMTTDKFINITETSTRLIQA